MEGGSERASEVICGRQRKGSGPARRLLLPYSPRVLLLLSVPVGAMNGGESAISLIILFFISVSYTILYV
jgi:hypothetical protein